MKKRMTTILHECIERGDFQGRDLLDALALLEKMKAGAAKRRKDAARSIKPSSALLEFQRERGIGDKK